MDEIFWSIRWSLDLIPDLSFVPDSSVFLCSPQSDCLAATVNYLPSLLDVFPEEVDGAVLIAELGWSPDEAD